MNTLLSNIKIRSVIIVSIIIAIITFIIGNYIIDENTIMFIGDIFIVIWLFIKLKKNKIDFKSYFKDYKEKLILNKKEIIKIVLVNMVFSTGISLSILLIVYFINADTFNYLLNEDITSGNSTLISNIYYFICVVIFAPFVEELIFRDILLNRLNKKFGIKKAILYSSIVFGILHIELAIIGAVIFGIIACILYLKYENILIPMTVHFINNFIVSLPLLFESKPSSSEAMSYNEVLISGSIGFIILILSSIWIYKYIKENAKYVTDNNISYEAIEEERLNKRKYKKIIIGVVICIVIGFVGLYVNETNREEKAIDIVKKSYVEDKNMITEEVVKIWIEKDNPYEIYGWYAENVIGDTYFVSYEYDEDDDIDNGLTVYCYEVNIKDRIIRSIMGNKKLEKKYTDLGYI